MFADSFCSPWANRSRRGWTTLVSFALQAIAVGSLLLLPLLYTSGLPRPQWMAVLAAPARPEAPASSPPQVSTSNSPVSNLSPDGHMMTPERIPHGVKPVTESFAPEPANPGLYVPGGTGDHGAQNGLLDSILKPVVNVALPPPPTTRVVHISHMTVGDLIYRVQPEYPLPAKLAHVQGAVVLHALISKQGTIEKLQVISGSPLLAGAAIEAVRQWRYRPYILNDEPVEVDTQVTVNFVLSGG